MKRSGKLIFACVAGTFVLGAGSVIAAADDRAGPSWAEFQKLQTEVRDQRQLIIQLMQSEQQRYDTCSAAAERYSANCAVRPRRSSTRSRRSLMRW